MPRGQAKTLHSFSEVHMDYPFRASESGGTEGIIGHVYFRLANVNSTAPMNAKHKTPKS